MPYIQRDASGTIIQISVRQLASGEMLPHTHPEVAAFLIKHGQDPEQIDQALAELRRTDGEMARAVEDIIMVLLKKNVIRMADLPKPVQDRMSFRVKQRMSIQEIYDQASARTGHL